MKGKLKYSLLSLMVVLVTGCSRDNVKLTGVWTVQSTGLTLDALDFDVTGHFNRVCLLIPEGYGEDFDNMALRSPSGELVVVDVSLWTQEGVTDTFECRGFRHSQNGHYCCLLIAV